MGTLNVEGMHEPLTVRNRMMLGFERRRYTHAGNKDNDIHIWFGCTPTRYYAELNGLLEHPGALVYDAQVVRRLQRLQEQRAAARSWKRVASD